jgi:hypothetical protein
MGAFSGTGSFSGPVGWEPCDRETEFGTIDDVLEASRQEQGFRITSMVKLQVSFFHSLSSTVRMARPIEIINGAIVPFGGCIDSKSQLERMFQAFLCISGTNYRRNITVFLIAQVAVEQNEID